MTTIDYQKAIESFPALIELAANGEDVVIAKNDQPFVKITGVKPSKNRRQFGSAKGLIQISDDFVNPLEDFQDYM
jgi:antitoxin (DNA-binding transcriptional repressor) of toxin-antitoxin stability system